MMNIRKKSKFSLFVLAIILLAQQICDAQDDLPFDVFGDSVDSQEVFRYLVRQMMPLNSLAISWRRSVAEVRSILSRW